MSEYLKNIKNQIEKMAQVMEQVPVRVRVNPTSDAMPSKGTPAPARPAGNFAPRPAGASEIREMQFSMQDLAETVIQDASSSTMALKNKDTLHQEANQHVQQSKKSFNDFIAEQYMGGLDDENKGVEWTKNPDVATHPDKKQTQTDIYELDVVMNTLSRIGNAKGEFKADGNWDWRTQNALKNMLGFAYSLLQLEGDFGLSNHTYNIANWNAFKTTLGDNSNTLPLDEKKAKAVTITKHLKAITKLYNDFRQQVIARPEFRPYLEGKRSLDKYDQNGTNKDTLSPQEIQMSKSDTPKIDGISYIAPRLPDKKLTYVPLKALSSKEEYLKWMLEYAGVPSEEVAWTIFNRVIKPKIEAL